MTDVCADQNGVLLIIKNMRENEGDRENESLSEMRA